MAPLGLQAGEHPPLGAGTCSALRQSPGKARNFPRFQGLWKAEGWTQLGPARLGTVPITAQVEHLEADQVRGMRLSGSLNA